MPSTRAPIAGAFSCLIFAASLTIFLLLTWKTGVPPLMRGGWQTVGVHTAFQELWTRVFLTSTFVGILVGGMDLLRRPHLRAVSIAGVTLNFLALGALILYSQVPA